MDRVAMYRDYLRNKPGDRFAMYSLALELKKAGDRAAAEVAFAELLALHPDSGAGHLQLGMMRADDGDEDGAAAAWEAGIAALSGRDEPDARRALAEIEGALAAIRS